MRDRQHALLPDHEVVVQERIRGHAHGAFGRVLERHDAVGRVLAPHGLEHGVDRGALAVARLEPEQAPCRELRERPLRAEIGHPERLLDGEAGAHHLAEDRADGVGGEALASLADEPVEHATLALGIIEDRHRGGALLLGDVSRDVGAPTEEIEDLIVERVDALAGIGEPGDHGACLRGPLRRRTPARRRLLSYFELHGCILA